MAQSEAPGHRVCHDGILQYSCAQHPGPSSQCARYVTNIPRRYSMFAAIDRAPASHRTHACPSNRVTAALDGSDIVVELRRRVTVSVVSFKAQVRRFLL